MKILVYHRHYGCDTGCCGHAVGWFPDDFVPEDKFDYYPIEGKDKFDFGHAYDENAFEYAKNLVRQELGEKHVADLDFENSFVVGDGDQDTYCG